MRLVLRLAWREARAAPVKFLFVVLAVAVGTGSLAGVRGFTASFRRMLLEHARTLMAADLSVRDFAFPTPAQRQAIEAVERRGVRHTDVTETVSMVSSVEVVEPLLVSVKAVDPARYPFYGTVLLQPRITLRQALAPDAVVASEDLLVRLRLSLGGRVRLGNAEFRIAAVVKSEPDRMTGMMNVGPRLLVSSAGLDKTGLMQPGSRAALRYLFKLGPGAPDIGELRRSLQKAFPEAQVADYRQTHPAITRGLNRASTFLSLVGLVALIVGGLGVAMAMHSHLEQRLDAIAMMKCIGARSGQVIRIYAAQAFLLALAGGLLGTALGWLVQLAGPPLVARYFPDAPGVSWAAAPALEALAISVLVTLLFTLPRLLAIRRVPPNLILRRDVAEVRLPWRERLGAPALAALVLLGGVASLAAWLSASPAMGAIFAGGLVVSLAVLSGVAWLLLCTLRGFPRHWRGRLPVAARQGMANLYRPGNHAGAVLVALGIGVTFTLAVYLIERGVVRELESSAPPGMPNVFLVNITGRERDGVLAALRAAEGVESKPELIPAVAARLVAVNGKPIAKMDLRGPVRRYLRTRQVTWSAGQPAHVQIVSGHWWKPGETVPSAEVADATARILGIRPGARLDWEAAGRAITVRVTGTFRFESTRPGSMFEFVMSPGVLDGLPASYFGTLRVRPVLVPRLQKALYDRYPTVTVVNVADVLAIVESVVGQIALVVRFLAAFVVLAGAVVVAASVAGTRFRRVREVAVLKTLGATRRRVVAIVSAEFLLLGAAAGVTGCVLATGLAGLTLHRLFDTGFRIEWMPQLGAIAAAAILAMVAGWVAGFRVLGQRPLEVLRGE